MHATCLLCREGFNDASLHGIQHLGIIKSQSSLEHFEFESVNLCLVSYHMDHISAETNNSLKKYDWSHWMPRKNVSDSVRGGSQRYYFS